MTYAAHFPNGRSAPVRRVSRDDLRRLLDRVNLVIEWHAQERDDLSLSDLSRIVLALQARRELLFALRGEEQDARG